MNYKNVVGNKNTYFLLLIGRQFVKNNKIYLKANKKMKGMINYGW
jgi:hypothetical protein